MHVWSDEVHESAGIRLKVCSKCKQEKPLTAFCASKRSKDGLAYWCRSCSNESSRPAQRRWAKDNPDKRLDAYLRRTYGINLNTYQQLLATQGGKCALCGSTEGSSRFGRLCVDHDHECCEGSRSCGKCVRGLLCTTCNKALRNVDYHSAALRYLAKYANKTVFE